MPIAMTRLTMKRRESSAAMNLIMKSGFTFEFPHWADAAADLCERWRAGRSVIDHAG